jgi:hypothetical protein
MSTTKNTTTATILWNSTTNRKATNNDLIKFSMVQMLKAQTEEEVLKWFKFLNEQKAVNELSKDETQHFPKHLARISTSLGNIRIGKVVQQIVQVSEEL